jgi:hypothetical protein
MSPTVRYPGTLARIRAVLAHRALYEIGAELQPQPPIGRPPAHPMYVHLVFATLARITRSTVRLEVDLQEPAMWDFVRQGMVDTLRRERLDLPQPGPQPPAWHHWRRARDDHLATDEGLAQLARAHLPRAVDLAHQLGLFEPKESSSLTHPSPRRAVYGDGTIVRPLYRPPRTINAVADDGTDVLWFIDPTTGQPRPDPPGRYDPDVARHQGNEGPALGHGYVAWHAHGPGRFERVILALGHIDHPGGEAAAAIALLGDIHRTVGKGIQVVIYDGALRGAHIETVMSRYGYLVIAKQPKYDDEDLATLTAIKGRDGKRVASIPLGVVTHDISGTTCHHTLAAINGAVAEVDLDDTGDPVVTSMPRRGPIKRARRSTGAYHFNVAYRIECPHGEFDTWLSPHPQGPSDPRPEALRTFPDGDPDTLRLRGLRSDAEAVHSQFKRTLLIGRAMSVGWRRGLLEYYCYAWYSNALAQQAAEAVSARTLHGAAWSKYSQ